VLEDQFELIVGNAHQIRKRPWPQDQRQRQRVDRRFASPRLIPKSFVPPKPIRELRFLP
jgi:hypothetical protein